MPTTVEKYVGKCQEIVDAKPVYKNGASSLTECDCIGMDKYAFRENGVKFSTTGTNYSARYQVNNLRPLQSASDLSVGDIVFKAKEPGASGYDLPEKYREGGALYNGDLLDYCHIGTVKSVSPLQIIHMTSPTAKTDTKIVKWAYVAEWQKEYISDGPDPEPAPEPTPGPTTAVVFAHTGATVNMRRFPNIGSALVERVPIGETVDVLEYGEEWCNVQWRQYKGYMMTRFLVFDGDVPPIYYTVTIPGLTKEQAESILMDYPNGYMTAG